MSIDQHFIQRGFLAAWQGTDHQLAYATKIDQRGWRPAAKRKPASALGYRTDYYTTGKPQFGPEWFELQFQEIETPGLRQIKAMRAGFLPNGAGSRKEAAEYLAMSLLRSLGLREWNRSRTDLSVEHFLEEWSDSIAIVPEEQRREYIEHIRNETDSVRPLEMARPLAVVYAKCHWVLLDAAVGSSFVMGDGFGVRIDNTASNEPGKMSGMGNSEFLVPLSPYRALLLIQGDESRHWGAQGESVLEHQLQGGGHGSAWAEGPVLTREGVALVNLVALAQAHTYVFGDFRSRIDQTIAACSVTGISPHDLRTGICLLESLRPAVLPFVSAPM